MGDSLFYIDNLLMKIITKVYKGFQVYKVIQGITGDYRGM